MEQKARMTFRYDSNRKKYIHTLTELEKPIDRNEGPEKSASLNEFTSEFKEWSSPFDMDTEYLNQVQMNPEPVIEGQFDHDEVMTYSDVLDQDPGRSAARHGLSRMMFSFFGALAGGLLLGYFALQFFSMSPQTDQQITTLPPQHSEQTVQGPLYGTDERTEDSPISQPGSDTTDIPDEREMMTLQLPGSSLYLLQNGMFSTEEKAIEASQALKQLGMASTAVRTDYIYIYAGILTLRDDAVKLSQLLQNEGFETYIKTFTMPEIESLQWTGNSEKQLAGYFQTGRELVRVLSELSYLYIQPHAPSGISEKVMEQLHERHKAWSNHAVGLGQSMPEDVQHSIQKINTAMNTAVAAFDEYNKSPSTSYVWQVQEAMLNYVHEEKKLIEKSSHVI